MLPPDHIEFDGNDPLPKVVRPNCDCNILCVMPLLFPLHSLILDLVAVSTCYRDSVNADLRLVVCYPCRPGCVETEGSSNKASEVWSRLSSEGVSEEVVEMGEALPSIKMRLSETG